MEGDDLDDTKKDDTKSKKLLPACRSLAGRHAPSITGVMPACRSAVGRRCEAAGISDRVQRQAMVGKRLEVLWRYLPTPVTFCYCFLR